MIDIVVREQRMLLILLGLILTVPWLFPRWWRQRRFSASDLLLQPYPGVKVFPVALAAALATLGIDLVPRTALLTFPEPFCTARVESQNLLLFIHGWRGDPNSTWKTFPSLLCADPRFTNTDVRVINYPTFLAQRNLNIISLADWLNRGIDAVTANHRYRRTAVIAHSMGGLVTREMIILRALHEDPWRADLLIEVATPHQGADVAALGAVLGLSLPLTQEVSPGSTLLVTLETEWQLLRRRPTTFCYTSPQDLIVSAASAVSQCDRQLRHPQWGHQELVKPLNAADPRYVLPVNELTSAFAN